MIIAFILIAVFGFVFFYLGVTLLSESEPIGAIPLVCGALLMGLGIGKTIHTINHDNHERRAAVVRDLKAEGWHLPKSAISTFNVQVDCLSFVSKKLGNKYFVVTQRPEYQGGGYEKVMPEQEPFIRAFCNWHKKLGFAS